MKHEKRAVEVKHDGAGGGVLSRRGPSAREARGKREPDGVSGAAGAVKGVERGKKREAGGAIEDGGGRRCRRHGERVKKQKAWGSAGGGGAGKVRRAGSTTDGKDVRRDHTLRQGDPPSAPQSFPILWWLGGVGVIVSECQSRKLPRRQRE